MTPMCYLDVGWRWGLKGKLMTRLGRFAVGFYITRGVAQCEDNASELSHYQWIYVASTL